jgi:hypothetical protein
MPTQREAEHGALVGGEVGGGEVNARAQPGGAAVGGDVARDVGREAHRRGREVGEAEVVLVGLHEERAPRHRGVRRALVVVAGATAHGAEGGAVGEDRVGVPSAGVGAGGVVHRGQERPSAAFGGHVAKHVEGRAPPLPSGSTEYTPLPSNGYAARRAAQLARGWHAPATHAVAAPHARPHAPQWALLVWVLVSHPLAALPSQLPKPVAQAPSAHAPPAQVAAALAKLHTVPHAPQCAVLVVVLVSHPLVALPSQLPNPGCTARARTSRPHTRPPRWRSCTPYRRRRSAGRWCRG